MTTHYPLMQQWLQRYHRLADAVFGVQTPMPTIHTNSTQKQNSEQHGDNIIVLNSKEAARIERLLKKNRPIPREKAEPFFRALALSHAFHPDFATNKHLSNQQRQDIADEAEWLLSDIHSGRVSVLSATSHPAFAHQLQAMMDRGNHFLGTQLEMPVVLLNNNTNVSRAYDFLRAVVVPDGTSAEARFVQAHELGHYLRAFDPQSNIVIHTPCGRTKEEHRADVLAYLMVPPDSLSTVSDLQFITKFSRERASYYLRPDQLESIAKIVAQQTYPVLHFDSACLTDHISSSPDIPTARQEMHHQR